MNKHYYLHSDNYDLLLCITKFYENLYSSFFLKKKKKSLHLHYLYYNMDIMYVFLLFKKHMLFKNIYPKMLYVVIYDGIFQ